MKNRVWWCLLIGLVCSTANAADKKFEIEVISVTEYLGTTVSSITYTAKIILPDGSHVLAICSGERPCALDGGYPERLKKTQLLVENAVEFVTTGYPKLEAKRRGSALTIYTGNKKREYKREYVVTDSW